MVEHKALHDEFRKAADHAEFKIKQVQQLIERPNLTAKELQEIMRVIDQLAGINSRSVPPCV